MTIITFGCSNTFGQGLPDVDDWLSPNSKPSEYAWPAMLGKFMKRDVKNLSICGSSNKSIWREVTDYPFKKKDVAIILWTFFYRTSILRKDRDNTLRILPGYTYEKNKFSDMNLRRLNKNYYKHFYDEFNLSMESWLAINHTKFYLDSKGIQNFHFTFELPIIDRPTEPVFILDSAPEWNAVDLEVIPFIRDFGNDNEHPGVKAHTKFSLDIANRLKGRISQ